MPLVGRPGSRMNAYRIDNSAQAIYCVRRWGVNSSVFRVGATPFNIDAEYCAREIRELDALAVGYVRPPLERWWEIEVANLPA